MRPVAIDRTSLVAEFAGDITLTQAENALAHEGLTLDLAPGVAPGERTIAEWLAEGAPGARDPWIDPVDHLVCGLDARLEDGKDLRIRPGPRRAVGPDLIALFVGMRGRFGTILRAHLRVHPRAVPRPVTHPFERDRNPALSAGEAALLEAIGAQLRHGRRP